MTNKLIKMEQNNLGIWEEQNSLKEIKNIFGRGLSDGEFQSLVQLGKATGLNPFLKEIWAVKYGNNPAQIFIGRDGYRKSAQDDPEYDYHLVDAVYSNDDFVMSEGQVTHRYKLADRGDLVGAYCVAKRKSAEKSMFIFVELSEYNTKKSLWAGKPATMIKKVAEAQCLRMAFQARFAGTYSEFEKWEIDAPVVKQVQVKGVAGLKNRLGLIEHNVDDVITKIKSAETIEELKVAAEPINHFTEEDKELLRPIYAKKQQTFINRSTTNV